MKHTLKTTGKNILLSLVLGFISVIAVQGQTTYIYGPTTANVNDVDLYTVNINDDIFMYHWFVIGGTHQFDNEYSTQVTWTTAGSSNEVIYDAEGMMNYYYGTKIVNVVGAGAPDIPPMPTITNNCGNTVLTRATPPTGVTYYWQSTSTGTSTSNSSVSITRTSGTVYYLRARDNSSLLWSDARVINYTIDQPPIWYEDQDGDGLGDPSSTQSACSQPTGYVSNSDDLCPTQSGTVANNGCPEGSTTTYASTFESSFGDWSQATYDDFDWTRKTGSTGSSGTGPTSASEGSYYIYTEASYPNYPSKTVIITSIAYALESNGTFTFDYHMYGATMGQLTLSASTNGGSTWQTIWSKQGDQGNLWHTAQVDLSSYQNTSVMFRFMGVTGTSYTGDMSVDNIVITSQSSSSTTFSNENYIYSITPVVPTTDVSSLDPSESLEAISYFDGLGRKIQTRGIRQSPLGKDIVTHFEYDDLGRESRAYLPYTSTNGDGFLETNAQSLTFNFYNTAKYENTLNPYAEKYYDGSPLNLTIETAAPGNTWKEGITDEHTVKSEYKLITVSDEVYNFSVSYSNDLPQLINNGLFDIGEQGQGEYWGTYLTPTLYKFITKNENWKSTDGNNNTVHTFKDIQGRIILSRTFESNIPYDTYYVYDNYGNLNYVIPPKVVVSNGIDSTELNELCYQYKYDAKNRLIEKKLPGKGWEYFIYDQLNRPILTQDAVQSAKSTKEWLFTKYDAFGRVAYTGLYKDNRSRLDIQASADAHTVKYESKGSTFYNYTNNAYPTNISSGDIYSINYYDDYNFDMDGLSIPSTIYGELTATNLKGLATGSKEKVLGTTTNYWITTITAYDKKGRSVYVATKNQFLGITDIVETKLDFTGKVDETTTNHTSAAASVNIVDTFDYDHVGRLTIQTQAINNDSTPEVIVKNTYDELGVLEVKKVGNTELTPLQTINYKYNIRGWLTEINDVDNIGSDLFTFKINYNAKEIPVTTDYSELYDGTVTETIWRTANDNTKRAYQYKYDDLYRLTGANYRENNDLLGGNGKFSTSYGYDKNGNLTELYRRDVNNNDMDELEYHYSSSSNKLVDIADISANIEGFQSATSTYSYEVNNGNLTSDSGKGITNIEYNYLNLPTKIEFGSTKRIEYIYSAGGVKLQKKVTDGSITTTNYDGSFIYVNNALKSFSQPEGYVEVSGSSFTYIYQYKDHLGSVRLNYTNVGTMTSPNLQIREENNYYPFGLKHKGYNYGIIGVKDDFKYNGKELQDDVINDKALSWYDYGARNYDATIGRWFVIDPLADARAQVGISPLAYAWNNPVNLVDPDGMHPDWNEDNFGMRTYYNPSISFDGNSFSFSGSTISSSEDVHVARYADGTVRIISANKFRKLVKEGVKNEEISEFNENISQENREDYILFTGKKVLWVSGTEGVLFPYYKGVSGLLGSRLDKEAQKMKNLGPVPEGLYFINLEPDPNRIAKINKETGALYSNPEGGIERVPEKSITNSGLHIYYRNVWGTMRARLQPLEGTNTYGRYNFYFHNSKKGHTSGCIECSTHLFSRLLNYRQNHSSIKVIVSY